MGVIVAMSGSNRPVRREGAREGGAEILFFTGVRYSRMPEPDPALASVTPPRRAPRKKRATASEDVKTA